MTTLQFGPYAAHVLLIAVVYGSLLLVIFVAFRSGRGSRPARANVSGILEDGSGADEPLLPAGENADLPPMPSLDAPFSAAGGGDDDEDGMPPPLFAGGARAAGDPLDRISAQLDYALTSPSVYSAKPREIIEHQRQQRQQQQRPQEQPFGPGAFGRQAGRALEAEAVDRDVEREQLRRQEVVRKREAEKAAAAEAIMQGRGTGGFAGAEGPRPKAPTYVAAAPLDAVYGAEPTNPDPHAAGPSAALPLSAEERILAMHVRGRG
jgi:hypothetical protein